MQDVRKDCLRKGVRKGVRSIVAVAVVAAHVLLKPSPNWPVLVGSPILTPSAGRWIETKSSSRNSASLN